MSDTANSFGGQAYQSQTTKALSSISESPGPDLSDGEQQFVSMLSRHDYQIKFLAANQQTLQVGVNQATSNPIQQIQQFIADLQVLLSGASLPKGALDFGDLQYIMPAIGALFGFGTGEYPINLFSAAEKFFFGYVVPTQQYTDLQIAGFNSWASQLGIDPKFIKDMDAMTQAFGDLFNGLQNLGPSLASLFDALGVSGNDLGPIGQFIASILKLFQPIDLSKFGSMIEFITDAMDPWINSLTAGINWINTLIAAIGAGGDVVNSPLPQVTEPFANLIRLFATLDFTDPQFSTSAGWGQLFQEVFIDLEQFGAGVWSWLTGAPLNAGNLYGQLSPGLFSNIPGTAITDDDTNLLINPAFSGAISVSGNGVWTWDGYCYYPPGDSTPTPGSVVVIADGTRKQLNSNQVTVGPKLQVTPGRVLTYAVQVLATHLTATGTPVQMGVETNLGVTILDQTLPLTVPSTTPWLNPPTGSNAGVLSGTYLVPQDGSVTWVSMILVLGSTATAGVVRFSNAFELLTGGLIGDLKSDIADLQDDSTASTAAFGTLLNSWWTDLTTPGQTPAALLAEVESDFATWKATNSAINMSASATITQIVTGLLGFDPTTLLLPSTQVGGLNDSFAQLGAAVSGDVVNAGDWAWLAQIVNSYYTLTGQAHSTAVDNANTLGIRDNKPLIYGLDDTTESSIAFTDAVNKINVTSASTEFGFVRCQQTDIKNTIAFTASTSSAPAGFFVNLYLVDFTNSTMRYINTSANLVSQLTSSEKWLFTTAAATPVMPGTVLAIEFQVTGSGSVDVFGKTITGKPTHPVAQLPGAAATRSGTPAAAQSGAGFTGLSLPTAVTLDSAGNVYVADYNNSRIVELSSGSQLVLGFTGMSHTYGVAVDSTGAVYANDYSNNRVLKLAGGTQTILGFSGLTTPHGIAVDSSGAVYVADFGNNRVVKLSGGTQTVLGFTGLSHPWDVVVDASGAVYVTDSGNNRVLKLAGGTQTVLGFTGLLQPAGIALDSSGNVYITDLGNNRVVKLVAGTQSVVGFSGLSSPSDVFVDPVGNVYCADSSNNRILRYSNDTGFSALVFNNTAIPYVGLETSSPPAPTFPDTLRTFTSPGTTTQILDTWVNFVDLIALGGGGGGEGETGAGNGPGGCAGGWNTQTLTVGTDIAVGGTLTITVGDGGPGGPYFTPGSPGVATTISWHDPAGTLHTLTGAAGLAGNAANNLTSWGLSPGNKTFPASGPHSETYIGGAQNAIGGVGNPPGGGGTGGAAFQYGFAGARGQAWIVERQS